MYNIGDAIQIVKGEYNGITGTISDVEIKNKVVKMKPDNKELKQYGDMDISIYDIAKFFEEGERVEVV